MSDRAQFIVLCEDLQAEVFIRKVLLKRGVEARKMRFVPLPSTAGDAHVLKEYPGQVKAFRSANARASYGLVVHIDADPGQTVAQRHDQLAQKLDGAGLVRRTVGEPIADLVPKRNIETWIYALDPSRFTDGGEVLDEETEYRKLRFQSDCAFAAGEFAEHARKGTSPAIAGVVPSLADGLLELRRLPL